MKTGVIIGILVVVLTAGIGGFLYMQSTDSMDDTGVATLEDIQNEKMEKTDTDTDSSDSMEKEEETLMEKDETASDSKNTDSETTQEEKNTVSQVESEQESTPIRLVGEYTTYADDAVAEAAEYGNVVLFFHAAWCPTCRALKNNITENSDEIPSDLTILEVDYDDSTALRQQYGVTYQHTLVQVDANGTLITKWSGGNTVESITSKLQ